MRKVRQILMNNNYISVKHPLTVTSEEALVYKFIHVSITGT